MLRTRKRVAKRHNIRRNKTHNKRHTSRRTSRRVYHKGGLWKEFTDQVTDQFKKIQGLITPEKEEEKSVNKATTGSVFAPTISKPAVVSSYKMNGGFSLGALKGHLKNTMKAAEKHTTAITAAVAPQIKATTSALQKQVTNVTKAVEANPLAANASQELKQFKSTAAKHISEGTAASHKAFIAASAALQHKMTNLQPHVTALVTRGKALAAKGAKKAQAALDKAQSAQASLL